MGQTYQPRKNPPNRTSYKRRGRRRRRWGFFGIPIQTLLLAAVLLVVAVVCFMKITKSEKIQSGEGSIKSMLSGQKTDNNTGTDKSEKLIMIDSGHGGNDPGCIKESTGGDIYEKDINLSIAKKLKTILEEDGYRVIMTRDEDIFLSLEERIALAKEKNPDLFISIHQNTLENDTTSSGIETHYYELPDIDSRVLAETIQKSVIQSTAAKDRGTFNDSDLYVLKNNTVPACLIETGFLSAKEEGNRLLQSEYQEKIAQGIAKGIQNYMEKR